MGCKTENVPSTDHIKYLRGILERKGGQERAERNKNNPLTNINKMLRQFRQLAKYISVYDFIPILSTVAACKSSSK